MSAIHWVENDSEYEQWLSQHQNGFVANAHKEPNARYFKIHKASHQLPDRSTSGSVNPRTGNQYSKVTADRLWELVEWAAKYVPSLRIGEANYCKTCDPAAVDEVETAPTADMNEYARRAAQIRAMGRVARPDGIDNPTKTKVTSVSICRDPKVRAWVLQRANGHCELCKSAAPFVTDDDEPYLESHHIAPLSDGGPDTPDKTSALCPNCHRALHFGNNRLDLGKRLKQIVLRVERSSRAR